MPNLVCIPVDGLCLGASSKGESKEREYYLQMIYEKIPLGQLGVSRRQREMNDTNMHRIKSKMIKSPRKLYLVDSA